MKKKKIEKYVVEKPTCTFCGNYTDSHKRSCEWNKYTSARMSSKGYKSCICPEVMTKIGKSKIKITNCPVHSEKEGTLTLKKLKKLYNKAEKASSPKEMSSEQIQMLVAGIIATLPITNLSSPKESWEDEFDTSPHIKNMSYGDYSWLKAFIRNLV